MDIQISSHISEAIYINAWCVKYSTFHFFSIVGPSVVCCIFLFTDSE